MQEYCQLQNTIEIEPSVILEADISTCFTYASFQNAIPVIHSIIIKNNIGENIEDCVLELNSSPGFLRPKSWVIDRIIAGEIFSVSSRKVDLDAAYLEGLNEAERGEIYFRFSSRGQILAEKHFAVRLLARDEWGGVTDMAQLLPAFVMPNDPAVMKILHSAAELLERSGHPSAMDGYQSNDPKRAHLLAASIYSAIAGLNLHYAEPPASFEKRGQKTRKPSTIMADKLATCLDTTLLFAAALEAAGLYPIILLFKGHAAVGVWLTRRSLSAGIISDPMEIRKEIALNELVVFETTGVTHRPFMTWQHAAANIKPRLDESRDTDFSVAIDVQRSRSNGITPLASHQPVKNQSDSEETADDRYLPLPNMSDFEELPADVVAEKPATAQGRIDRWQKKLLDLTLRNRLLNFPETKKTVPFFCPDIGYLEDRLANEKLIKLISLPEHNPHGERDEVLYREIKGDDLNLEFAKDALHRDELASKLATKELQARLIELHRQVRHDFSESGANTLFLTAGFLRWKKQPRDDRSYRAPLLLIPVKLERKSASSPFFLKLHEDEPRFNATLLEFLERDFDLRLPQFKGNLPTDEHGIDVPGLLASVRRAVRESAGMEVVDETALSTFSFAKFLMWKDLVERTDSLRNNRVVKYLIDTPDQVFDASDSHASDERQIDYAFSPSDIISILPADSSQIAASMAAAAGQDFVLVGPPGTGKSQTIANMIANCLAVGKTVLFVAEKTAALDVVYRRLRENGLGDYCLELHSNKTDRRHFLAQLKKSWKSNSDFKENDWITVNNKLRILRDQLNAYVNSLHKVYSNGLTPYEAFGIALRGHEHHAPSFGWPSADAHDEESFRYLADLTERLGRTFQSIEHRNALKLVDKNEWTSAWQEKLLASARDVYSDLNESHRIFITLRDQLGLNDDGTVTFHDLQKFYPFAQNLADNRGVDQTIIFDPDFAQIRPAIDKLQNAIDVYRNAGAGLSAVFEEEEIARVPIDALELEWKIANASFWPRRWLASRRVKKMLQSYAQTGHTDPEKDLPLLRKMQGSYAAIKSSNLAEKLTGFAGIHTDIERVNTHLAQASQLRSSLNNLGKAAENITRVLQSVLASPAENNTVRQTAAAFVKATSCLFASLKCFSEVAGINLVDSAGGALLTDIMAQMTEIRESRNLLRDWTSWCRVRQEAIAHNLVSLVQDIENGAIAPNEACDAFKLGYVRWWMPLILDADPVLRDFRRFAHEHAIHDFRQIDDLIRKQAASRVISGISHDLPDVQAVPRKSELGLLRHQMDLQRPSKSIREMVSEMPTCFSKLAPCMLMSPLSIAQYFPPDQTLFDVVIFDEASQITTWDAVGAIARGRQTIIVGDPKQLPPTNFFGRNEEDKEVEDYEKDLESILDEAKNSGIPVRDLRWHYRSRNESLIAFSNHHYYQNRLVTFPSPVVDDRAVSLCFVADGTYDRGKSRTNRIEAFAVAGKAVQLMTEWLEKPETERLTLGIITFNAQQQSLIQDILDQKCQENPQLEWFFSEERIEPAIVKNLENVQGDERDFILFSITFAPDASGKRTMDFGALNRDGGERRLNVAVTRARQELVVFSGFTADQIDTDRTKAKGVHDLKTFLDFANRGAIALPAVQQGSLGGFDSPFEEAVASELEHLGWQVVPQVGISGFRIDLGVKHPDFAGAYLAGVECDGATYHSSATARDRDKIREQVLVGLGWNIVRIWSTDWWFDTRGAVERLHNELNMLLEQSRCDNLIMPPYQNEKNLNPAQSNATG